MSLLKPIFGFCFQTIVEFICLKVTWYTIFDILRICSVLILAFNVRAVFFLCSHRDNLLTFPYYRDVSKILVTILRFISANTRIILNTLKFSDILSVKKLASSVLLTDVGDFCWWPNVGIHKTSTTYHIRQHRGPQIALTYVIRLTQDKLNRRILDS